MFRENEDLLSPEGAELETEMLQTDIQRFLAILAFSLLPIFMLVQAIPVVSQEKEAIIKEIQRPVEAQVRRMAQSSKESAPPKKEAQKEDRQVIPGEMRQETPIDKTPAAEKSMAPKIDKEPAVEKKEDPKAVQGLYVAFESDRVFLDLLEGRKVELFISLPAVKQSFRVFRQDGKIAFDAGIPSGGLDLWEIREIMVPAEIRDAFKKWTTLASREKMFVVGLPSELSQQIRDRRTQGGRILIGGQGTVHLRDQGD